MKKDLFAAALGLALSCVGCGDTEAAKPVPVPPESGRRAMAVDGKESGLLEKQGDGTYLLRYSSGAADRVSVNEVILMPDDKGSIR